MLKAKLKAMNVKSFNLDNLKPTNNRNEQLTFWSNSKVKETKTAGITNEIIL